MLYKRVSINVVECQSNIDIKFDGCYLFLSGHSKACNSFGGINLSRQTKPLFLKSTGVSAVWTTR